MRKFFHRPRTVDQTDKKVLLKDIKLDRESFYFVPIGGTAEFGMNLNLYYFRGKWIIVDIGVSFEILPYSSHNCVLLPSMDFVRSIPTEDVLGVFLTHGHEDHIGAIQYLSKYLPFPMYTTPFTAKLINRKVEDYGTKADVRVVEYGKLYSFGDPEDPVFRVQWINVTHSIPDSSMLLIEAVNKDQVMRVIHTGDWKFDSNPLIGPKSDLQKLKDIGEKGVLAVVGDSTKADSTQENATEGEVQEALFDRLKHKKTGRIVIVCFSSNVARVHSAMALAKKLNRSVGFVGRSLQRIKDIAMELGYLDATYFLDEDDIIKCIPEKTLLICTGAQAEINSGLRRLAEEEHPRVKLSKGDTVIISARAIPGNEKEIRNMMNRLARRGIEIITASYDDDSLNASGHPTQHDLKQLYELLRPKYVLPVHGEFLHLDAHAKYAKSLGFSSILLDNGFVVNLSRGCTIENKLEISKLMLDGRQLVPVNGLVHYERSQLINGVIFVSLFINKHDKVFTNISTMGVSENPGNFITPIKQIVLQAVEETVNKHNRKEVISNVKLKVLDFCFAEFGKNPVVMLQCSIAVLKSQVENSVEKKNNTIE